MGTCGSPAFLKEAGMGENRWGGFKLIGEAMICLLVYWVCPGV
jgi:hypothetical protein